MSSANLQSQSADKIDQGVASRAGVYQRRIGEGGRVLLRQQRGELLVNLAHQIYFND